MAHAGYLTPLFNPDELGKRACKIADEILKDIPELRINCIVVTGISGTTFGGIVSVLTGLPLVIVRKNTEDNHSGRSVEFPKDLGIIQWAFVDDLISYGNTLRKCMDELPKPSFLRKMYFYNQSIAGATSYIRQLTEETKNMMEDVPYFGMEPLYKYDD